MGTACPPSGGNSTYPSVQISGTSSEINQPVETTIGPNEQCTVEQRVEFWAKAEDEPHTLNPKRYTQVLHLYLENITALDAPIRVKLTRNGGTDWEMIELPH